MGSILLNDALLSACITYTVCYWTLRSLDDLSSGLQPEKEVTKQTSGWRAAPCVMPSSEVDEDSVYTLGLFCLKYKGHFTGIFLGPFQKDKGSQSGKFPAVPPAVSPTRLLNISS